MAFTFFFRDLDCLAFAVKALIPQTSGRSRVRIWNAGCATGHEPYTLAILLAESMGAFALRNLEIHATDHDEPLLQVTREGVYLYDELKRIPEDYFSRYFTPQSGCSNRFRVIDRLRGIIRARNHDLLSCVPVRDNFSLIVCKNVLLHFQPRERVNVIRMFHRALEPDGLFVTERTQKMPSEAAGFFRQVSPEVPVYRKYEKPL
jgi:chemotaxis protein methyltransferase CheR